MAENEKQPTEMTDNELIARVGSVMFGRFADWLTTVRWDNCSSEEGPIVISPERSEACGKLSYTKYGELPEGIRHTFGYLAKDIVELVKTGGITCTSDTRSERRLAFWQATDNDEYQMTTAVPYVICRILLDITSMTDAEIQKAINSRLALAHALYGHIESVKSVKVEYTAEPRINIYERQEPDSSNFLVVTFSVQYVDNNTDYADIKQELLAKISDGIQAKLEGNVDARASNHDHYRQSSC